MCHGKKLVGGRSDVAARGGANSMRTRAAGRSRSIGTHGPDSTEVARWPVPSAGQRERMDPPEVGPVAEDGERDPVPQG